MRATKAGTNGGPYGDVSVCRRISDLGFSRFHWPGRHYWPEAPSLNGCMTQHFVGDRVSSKTFFDRIGFCGYNAVIDERGNVVQVRPVNRHPLLIPAALRAVLQWKYEPTLLNGTPVAVEMEVTVHFSLGS
jgi:hypothetical protein